MLANHLDETAKKLLNLRVLGAGYQEIQKDGDWFDTYISYLWIIVIQEQVVILCSKMYFEGKEQQLRAMWSHDFREGEEKPKSGLYKIQVNADEIDPIAESLSTMNMLPQVLAIEAGGNWFSHYQIYAFTHLGRCTFAYRGLPQSENMRHFWNVLIAEVSRLARLSDDKEILRWLDWLIEY
jgi:hypothetical protein